MFCIMQAYSTLYAMLQKSLVERNETLMFTLQINH